MSNRSNGQQQQDQRSPNRPVHTIRYGTIKVAIWRNMVDVGNASMARYNVTASRSYKDGDEQWHDTQSFGYDDLLILAKALNEAHTWIANQMLRDREEEQQGEPEQQQSERRQQRSNGSNRGR